MKVQGLLLLLARLSLVAIDNSLQQESASLVASAWSFRMTSPSHARHLSIANPHSTDDDYDSVTATKDKSSSSSTTKDVNPYAVKADDSSSSSETTSTASTSKTSDTQKAASTSSSSTSTSSAAKTNATSTQATAGKTNTTQAIGAKTNTTKATTNTTKSGNATTTKEYDDDDNVPALSQWNASDLTMVPGENNETSLLPPEGEPPETWPIIVGSIFFVVAVVLCAMTGVRAYRNRSKRQGYEEVQTIVV